MFLITQHFGRMAAMVEENVPYNQEVFAKNAMLVQTLSRFPWEASIVPGTDSRDITLNSEVFMKPAEFKEVAQNFETQTAKLASVAQSGYFTGIKAHFGQVCKSCKACHTHFRSK